MGLRGRSYKKPSNSTHTKTMLKKLTNSWLALYTKARHEKKVYRELCELNIESYLPLQTTIKQWSDRKKKVEEPMIKSYVFVKVSEKEYNIVLNIPGASRYIFFEGKPAIIPEWQIEVMKKMAEYDLPHFYSSENFKKGEKIKINAGPMEGYQGEVVHDSEGKQKVIIRIDNIGFSVVVESPASTLEIVNKNIN